MSSPIGIQITNEHVAIVDESDAERLLKFRWWIDNGYAKTKVSGRVVQMAAMLMPKRSGYIIDHKNRNRLDSRRENLRWATAHQNSKNRSTHSNNTSGAKGVSFHVRRNKWVAYIRGPFGARHLGCFNTVEEASAVRRLAEMTEGNWSPDSTPTPEPSRIIPQRISRLNRSGHLGVSWNPRYKKWEVSIMVGGKGYYGGRFSDLELAAKECDKLRHRCKSPRQPMLSNP